MNFLILSVALAGSPQSTGLPQSTPPPTHTTVRTTKSKADPWDAARRKVEAGQELKVYVGTGMAPAGYAKLPPRGEFRSGLYRCFLKDGRAVMEPLPAPQVMPAGVGQPPFAPGPGTTPATPAPPAGGASSSSRVADLFRGLTPTPVGSTGRPGTTNCPTGNCPYPTRWYR